MRVGGAEASLVRGRSLRARDVTVELAGTGAGDRALRVELPEALLEGVVLRSLLPGRGLHVDRLRVEGARVDLSGPGGAGARHRLEGVDAEITGLRLPPTGDGRSPAEGGASAAAGHPAVRAEDGVARIASYEAVADDGRRRASVRHARIAAGEGRIEIDEAVFRSGPPTPPDDRAGGSRDSLRIRLVGLRAAGLDVGGLLGPRRVRARRIQVDSFRVESSVDETDRPSSGRPRLPAELVRDAPFPIHVDTIRLAGGRIRYSELDDGGGQAGEIVFEEVQGLVTHLVNRGDSAVARVAAHGRIGGSAPLEVDFRFPIRARRADFSYRGRVRNLDAEILNALLVPIEGLRIDGGVADSLWFEVDVNRGHAFGGLSAIYRDLEISRVDRSSGGQDLGEWVQTVFTDLKLRDRNPPTADAPLEVGTIDHARGARDPFFKFVWDALRTGLVDVIGL